MNIRLIIERERKEKQWLKYRILKAVTGEKGNEKVNKIQIEKLSAGEAVMRAGEIVRVYRESWVETYPNTNLGITKRGISEGLGDEEEMIVKWREEILNDKKRAIWIAKEGEVVVGFCVARQDETENELEYLYLLAENQGKGIGKQLMEKAIEWLGERKPIVLYGASYNERAIRFYEGYGFTLCDEEIPPKVLANGLKIPSMKMRREEL